MMVEPKEDVDSLCVIGAITMFFGNFFRVLIFTRGVGNGSKPEFRFQKWQHLDADYIKDQWRWRRSVSGWEITSALFSVVGWCCIVLPVVTFAYVQSRGGRHMVPEHLAIACLVLAGAFFEGIDALMTLGSESTMFWVSRDFDLGYGNPDAIGELTNATDSSSEGYGWKALEVTYLVSQGTRLWIDAIDWFFLSVLLVLVHRSVSRDRNQPAAFPLNWARLGLVVAALAFTDFVASCARFAVDWRAFSALGSGLSVANAVVLLPAWLLWFGVHLPRARTRAFAALASRDLSGGARGGTGEPGVELTAFPEANC